MTWKVDLKSAFRTPAELLAYLEIDSNKLPDEFDGTSPFPTLVPQGFASCMEKGNAQDPLLLQVLPLQKENQTVVGFSTDPLQEKEANVLPGLLHKYHGRVLWIVTGGCAIHCRYCFRRHFAYDDNNPNQAGWGKIIDYIKADTSITEVILSGGDPLLLSDTSFSKLMDLIESVPHVHTVRIHSRMPVVLPSRITDTLVERLQQSRLNIVMVIHANHANELSDDVAGALATLKNMTLLNQAVLLNNINDTPDTQIALQQRLFKIGVLPYYLHLLDPVAGTAHFEVSRDEGQKLITAMQAKLPGYLVPKLVREVAGEANKLGL
jgi:EF-P beta-lysylation protein EpmB